MFRDVGTNAYRPGGRSETASVADGPRSDAASSVPLSESSTKSMAKKQAQVLQNMLRVMVHVYLCVRASVRACVRVCVLKGVVHADCCFNCSCHLVADARKFGRHVPRAVYPGMFHGHWTDVIT